MSDRDSKRAKGSTSKPAGEKAAALPQVAFDSLLDTSAMGPGVSRRWSAAEIVAALLAAVVVLTAVWLVPRPIGDLYVALAGGRDVVDGKMGQPDDWSFMSVDPKTGTNRIWINQNWGTHLVYYLAYQGAGGWGLLAVKAAMLLATAFFIAARFRGIALAIGILVAVGVLLAGRSFIDLRPNLTTLMLTPLVMWLLYRSYGRPNRIWWVALVLWIWANSHGGFMFGLGMMVLWTICMLVPPLLGGLDRPKFRQIARKYWQYPAATIVAIILAAFANPFPWVNITHPIIMTRSDVWLDVAEWHSIFDQNDSFGTSWEFWIVLGCTAGLSLLRLFVTMFSRSRHQHARQSGAQSLGVLVFLYGAALSVMHMAGAGKGAAGTRRSDSAALAEMVAIGVCVVCVIPLVRLIVSLLRGETKFDLPRLGWFAFEAILSVVAVAMAVKSRRFIPLAMIVMAPMLAMQILWTFNRAMGAEVFGKAPPSRRSPASLRARCGRVPLSLGLAVVLILASVPLMQDNLRFYDGRNPCLPRGSLFDMMNHSQISYPPKLAEFFNANQIGGRMFTDWRWEGYMRWMCPQLKNFMGGRAQQAYDEQAYREFANLYQDLPENLRRREMSFVIVPAGYMDFSALCKARWTVLFFDGSNVAMVSPDDAKWHKLAQEGAARFPDAQTQMLTEALRLHLASGPDDEKALAALKKACEHCVNDIVLRMYLGRVQHNIGRRAGADRDQAAKDALGWFQAQDRRYEAMGVPPGNGMKVLQCRYGVLVELARLHKNLGQEDLAAKADDRAMAVKNQIKTLAKEWVD